MTDAVLGITGATGGLGGRVARALAARGVAQRLIVRDPSRAPRLPGATLAPAATYGDRAAAVAALEGVRTLLMVSAAETAERREEHRAFVEAAVAAGVEHVVYTSFYGAAPDCTFTLGRDHWYTEELLRASGLRWTFLRDNLYLDFLSHLAGEDGVIRGPAGDGRLAGVTRDDVAASALAVLLAPGEHVGATYDLTGPEALDFTEIAATIAAATGRPVRFHDETVEEAYRSRRRWEAPQWQYDAWVSTYTAVAAGELAGVTDHVERLTGRAPTGLAAYLRQQGDAG